jgi:hypothetical protein
VSSFLEVFNSLYTFHHDSWVGRLVVYSASKEHGVGLQTVQVVSERYRNQFAQFRNIEANISRHGLVVSERIGRMRQKRRQEKGAVQSNSDSNCFSQTLKKWFESILSFTE